MQVTGNNSHNQHIISIRIAADGFSFYIFRPQADMPLVVSRYPLDKDEDPVECLQRCLDRINAETEACDRIYALVESPSTRIPLEHFRKDEAEALYRLTFPGTAEEDKILYNILPHVETVELFSLPRPLSAWLYRRFPDIRVYGQYSMMLEKLLRCGRKAPSARHLFVYLDDKKLFACLFREGKLAFANTYAVESPGNRLYFILYAWKSLELDAEQDRCVLLNNHPCRKETAAALRPYLRHVEEPEPADLFPRAAQAQASTLPLDLFMLLTND